MAGVYLAEVRLIILRFENLAQMHETLVASSRHRSLPVPASDMVPVGEWVLAMFEIGTSRRATAAAGRAWSIGPVPHLFFEQRDWERLTDFAACSAWPTAHSTALGASTASWHDDTMGAYDPDTDPSMPAYAAAR